VDKRRRNTAAPFPSLTNSLMSEALRSGACAESLIRGGVR
jgi:hypothetical protein